MAFTLSLTALSALFPSIALALFQYVAGTAGISAAAFVAYRRFRKKFKSRETQAMAQALKEYVHSVTYRQYKNFFITMGLNIVLAAFAIGLAIAKADYRLSCALVAFFYLALLTRNIPRALANLFRQNSKKDRGPFYYSAVYFKAGGFFKAKQASRAVARAIFTRLCSNNYWQCRREAGGEANKLFEMAYAETASIFTTYVLSQILYIILAFGFYLGISYAFRSFLFQDLYGLAPWQALIYPFAYAIKGLSAAKFSIY